MSPSRERRLLQLVILIAAVVPVTAGFWGAMGGLHPPSVGADSEARYLSGILMGIGLCFWACIPTIERRGREVRVLVLIVVIGGLARLAGALFTEATGTNVLPPLVMELAVTPLVALWRERVERRLRPLESFRTSARAARRASISAAAPTSPQGSPSAVPKAPGARPSQASRPG